MLQERTDILDEDRAIIEGMLKKRFNPYLRRHEWATENASRMNDMVFNQNIGHGPGSRMRQVYVHELGNEGNIELKIMKGLMTREQSLSPGQKARLVRYCPECREPNEDSDKVCFNCGCPLSIEERLKAQAETEKFAKEY